MTMLPEFHRSGLHWSMRWSRLFIAWHRGINVTAYNATVAGIKAVGVGLWFGTIEVSWGPVGRSAGQD